MSDATDTGPVLAADGTPLKRSLNRALRQQKTRALLLIAPLLIYVMVSSPSRYRQDEVIVQTHQLFCFS